MHSSAESARQTIISNLKLFQAEAQSKGTFPWSFSSRIASPSVDNEGFEELRTVIRAAESVEDLLRRMLTSASSAVTELKYKLDVMANRRKFKALPDEVLAIVFEMAFKSYSSDRGYTGDKGQVTTVKKLSLVSRRFRNIVLSLPILWSNIPSPLLHVNEAKLFASRVTTPIVSLTIEGVESYESEESEKARVLSMYQLATSISSRIRKLDISLSKSDLPYLQQLRQTYSNFSLPSLFELNLRCYNQASRECRNFCRDWDMPSLRGLKVAEVLPELSSNVLSRIEFCSISANYIEETWRTTEIMEFLLSLTVVKDLRVSVRLSGFYPDSDQGAQLESVEKLSLALQNTNVAMDKNILHFIKFPSITSFNLDVGLTDIRDLEEILGNVTFKVPPLKVADVNLAVGIEFEDYDSRMPTFMIGEWSQAFEGLKTLTLESNRSKAHGLFAFADSIDAIKLIDPKEEGLTGEFLANMTHMWDSRRPHRTAVIDANDVSDSK
ncbi:hypothetical protein SCHPADRAFT_529682 [Schizopora paradoxa]|uniref:F-box domain-containing protein n=1 Tax=Schizopora paradoxa TaxID=27342 RepID=A0A0H2RZH3_9AGAM|nr:hypothetical protein SCHPADRAFT_529682 [Schizopora paradoxa]